MNVLLTCCGMCRFLTWPSDELVINPEWLNTVLFDFVFMASSDLSKSFPPRFSNVFLRAPWKVRHSEKARLQCRLDGTVVVQEYDTLRPLYPTTNRAVRGAENSKSLEAVSQLSRFAFPSRYFVTERITKKWMKNDFENKEFAL